MAAPGWEKTEFWRELAPGWDGMGTQKIQFSRVFPDLALSNHDHIRKALCLLDIPGEGNPSLGAFEALSGSLVTGTNKWFGL